MEKITHELKQLRKLAALLQSAWHYGEWKAETVNERKMETIMRELGYWPVTINEATREPNITFSQLKERIINMGEINNNNPGNMNENNNSLDQIQEHFIIRETVGYEFLNNVAVEDIPEVIKFLKLIFNYTKMNQLDK